MFLFSLLCFHSLEAFRSCEIYIQLSEILMWIFCQAIKPFTAVVGFLEGLNSFALKSGQKHKGQSGDVEKEVIWILVVPATRSNGEGQEQSILYSEDDFLLSNQFTNTWQRERPGSTIYSCALGIYLQGCWQAHCSSGNAVLSMRDPKTVSRKAVRSLPSLSFEQTKCLNCFSESL